jgi:flagellar hook-length control protein FliK
MIHSGFSREEKGDASGNSMNFGSDGKSQRASGTSEQSNAAVPVDFKDLLSTAKSSATQSAQAGTQSLRADPQEIISQIMDKAKLVSTRESSSVTISLRPENLGKVEFELVFRDGTVTARFVAESNQVKELLESNMDHLKNSLQKAGIEVGGMEVSVGQERSGSSSGTGESWSSSGRPSVQQVTESVEAQTSDSVNRRVHDGLLDIVA